MECDQCGARRPRSGPCPECGAPAPGTYSSMRQWRDQSRSGQGPAVRRASYDYDEVDLGQALVPAGSGMLPMDPSALSMAAGVPALPGIPQTDEEERAIGIRRPVYIPATGRRRRRRLASWRVLSGIVSVMLFCVASCGALALFGHAQLASFLSVPIINGSTPQAYSTAGVPVTPVATPGPQHTFVTHILTSKGVSPDFVPVDETSHFQTQEQVDVVCTVGGFPKGQRHTVSIHWFFDGVDMQLPILNGKTSEAVTSTQVVYFAMVYPTAGVGMAKIFFDLPTADTGDGPNDPYLAGQILFAIDPAGRVSGTPTQVPTGTPKVTPKPTPKTTPTAGRPTPTALLNRPGSAETSANIWLGVPV